MKRKNFYISIIAGLVAALSLELAYMKSEESKIKSAIVKLERRGNATENKAKEFSRDAGFFIRGLSEAQKLREKEIKLESDEEIIERITNYFKNKKEIEESSDQEEGKKIFYDYESRIYRLCDEMERKADEYKRLGYIRDREEFKYKISLIRGILNEFSYVFPGEVDRQRLWEILKGKKDNIQYLEEEIAMINKEVMALSEEGRNRIRKIIDQMNKYNEEAEKKLKEIEEWNKRSERLIERVSECNSNISKSLGNMLSYDLILKFGSSIENTKISLQRAFE